MKHPVTLTSTGVGGYAEKEYTELDTDPMVTCSVWDPPYPGATSESCTTAVEALADTTEYKRFALIDKVRADFSATKFEPVIVKVSS